MLYLPLLFASIFALLIYLRNFVLALEEESKNGDNMNRIRMIVNYVYQTLNVPKHISNHIFGAAHTESHRIFSGIIVMLIGVVIAKIEIHTNALHYMFDGTGYLLHAIGTFPIIEYIKNKTK